MGASNVSPRGSSLDHSVSTPGMRTRAPAGTSHSSAARSPCQRNEYDTGPSFVGASRTSSGSPLHSRGSALSSSRSVPRAVDERAADRVEERSGTAGRVALHVVPRRAIRRATGGLAPGEHAEANPRGAGFVVEAPVFERDDHVGHRQPRLARQQELRALPSRPPPGARNREGRPASPDRGGRATRGRPARRRARSRRPRRRSAAGAGGTAAESGGPRGTGTRLRAGRPDRAGARTRRRARRPS